MTPEEAKEKIVEAIREGRVEFAHPLASECWPSKDGLFPSEPGCKFKYIQAEMFPRSRGRHEGGIIFHWGIEGRGFGEVTVCLRDGLFHADTETMSVEFLKDLLNGWVDRMIINGKPPADPAGQES